MVINFLHLSRVRRRVNSCVAFIAFSFVAPLTLAQVQAPVEPETTTITLPVVSDCNVFTQPGEPRLANLGAARELQFLGPRALALMRFDLAPIKDQHVVRATLRLHRSEFHLVRVGVSTIAAGFDWNEGNTESPEEEAGAPCYKYLAYAPMADTALAWGRAGGTLAGVTFGNGGTRWGTIIPRFDRRTDWFELDIPAAWINAMRLGVQSNGLALADDFNRFEAYAKIHSRESAFPPVLEVEVATPPISEEIEAPTNATAMRDELGREWLEFNSPETIGYEIAFSKTAPRDDAALQTATRIPRYGLPVPAKGLRRALLSFERKPEHNHVSVRAMDAGGNWSRFVTATLPRPIQNTPAIEVPRLNRYDLPKEMTRPFTMDAGPALSEDGRWIRSEAKTWWEPFKGPIKLQAGRNEFVAFQIVLAGGPGTYSVSLTDWTSPGAVTPAVQTELLREHYVRSRLGREKYAPDPLIPIENGTRLTLDLMTPAQAMQPASQPVRRNVVQTIWADCYVPKNAARGVWRCRAIVVHDGRAKLDIPVELEVVAATLPDKLHYPISLRSRRMPFEACGLDEKSPEAASAYRAYHRTAHAHRLTFAPLPYQVTGDVYDGFIPRIDVTGSSPRVDWTDWQQRFGGLFDGSAFRDLPRGGQPLDHFTLPLFENWPMYYRFANAAAAAPLADKYHFRTSRTEIVRSVRANPPPASYMPWPFSRAFPPSYSQGINAITNAFAEKIAAAKWSKTDFDIVLANRPAGSAPVSWWFLVEPIVPDDERGLDFMLQQFRAANMDSTSLRRHAILGSPERVRDMLIGDTEVAELHESLLTANSLALSHPDRFPTIWTYLSNNEPEVGWSKLLAQGWSHRIAGAHGAVIQDSLGDRAAWEEASPLAVLMPSQDANENKPATTARLKSLRRLQQDMEWVADHVRRSAAREIPEGPVLTFLGRVISERSAASLAKYPTLVPVLEMPGRVDTVIFEELRRALRAAASRNSASAINNE